MEPLRITEIWTYPIKSLGGISMPAALVQRRGLQYDRRWMLVDDTGRFVSQREIPAMALLSTAIDASNLTVFHKDDPARRISIPLHGSMTSLPKIMVQIWSVRCAARLLPAGINDWFSTVLEQNLRLVWMPDTTRRAADGRYAPKQQYVSFADDMPFLLIGQASLDELNSRLDNPLPMNRFRPNLVVTGSAPFSEDAWEDFHIGAVPFKGVKCCGRCAITTIDQETAVRAAEPLQTLATYRLFGRKINFGRDAVWMGNGENDTVRVGDTLTLAPAPLA